MPLTLRLSLSLNPVAGLCARSMPPCPNGYWMHGLLDARMWHFIIEATPKDHPVILAVLDDDCFHALDFPCRYSEDGRWIDVTSGRSVDVRPTHWREWASRPDQ